MIIGNNMELTLEYITQHLNEYLPKENCDYCGTVKNYHYNTTHGEWHTSDWRDIKYVKESFDTWYNKNITNVYAIMPMIVNGKISGKPITGFIIKNNYTNILYFTSVESLNSVFHKSHGHSIELTALHHSIYGKCDEHFKLFSTKQEAIDAYKQFKVSYNKVIVEEQIHIIDKEIEELELKLNTLKSKKNLLINS